MYQAWAIASQFLNVGQFEFSRSLTQVVHQTTGMCWPFEVQNTGVLARQLMSICALSQI